MDEDKQETLDVIHLAEKDMMGTKPDIKLPKGCWVAGGAIRRWRTGEDSSHADIDVFAVNWLARSIFIKANGLTDSKRTKRHTTFKNSRVQLIHVPEFKDPVECMDHFDFTMCQFAWDGETIFSTKLAIQAISTKTLSVHQIQEGYEYSSLFRAFKYQRQGYTPSSETLATLTNALQGVEPWGNSNSSMSDDTPEDAEN